MTLFCNTKSLKSNVYFIPKVRLICTSNILIAQDDNILDNALLDSKLLEDVNFFLCFCLLMVISFVCLIFRCYSLRTKYNSS